MWRVLTLVFALLVSSYLFGIRPARRSIQNMNTRLFMRPRRRPKHHPHPQAHAEHSKKKEEAAVKHVAKKEEHGKDIEKKHQLAAQEKKKEENRKKDAEKKHQHTAQEKRIVETLHKVVANLHRADHDYDNQRHKALEHVQGAPGLARAGPRRDWQIRRYDPGEIGRDPAQGARPVAESAVGAIGERRPGPSRRGPAEG